MASIVKRGTGRCRARYRTPDGRQRSKTFRRKADAERFLSTVRVEMERGSWVDPRAARLTFSEWTERYFETTHKRPTTEARGRAVLRRWLLPVLGGVQLGSITPELVSELVDAMRAELAPATVRTHYGVLRAIMAKAVERDLIARSPCRGIDLPKPERKEPRFLSMDELHSLGGSIPVQYRSMVYLAGVVGLSWSEVAGLRVGRLDFLRRTVSVVETLAEVDGRLMFAPPKSAASDRVVSVPAPVMEMLAEHLARAGRPGPDELVFVSPSDEPLRPPTSAPGYGHRRSRRLVSKG